MKLAVVILNWNGKALLERFLPSVVKYSNIDDCSVVVADNGSDDGSVDYVSRSFPSVKLVLFDQNYGFTGGYNRAIEQVDAKYVLLLNSDVEVTKGWLEPLLEVVDSDPLVAAVMPKILSLNRPNYFEYAGAAGGFIDYIGLPYCRGRILSQTEQDKGQYDSTLEVFWASGAAMLVNRELFLRFGGLDSDFFAHMEEIDLCWRFKNGGYKIVCEPKSMVYHLGGATLSNNSPYKLFLNFRNSLYTLYKNLSSGELFFVLFLRMLFDGFVSILYLLSLNPSKFYAVLKAHVAFYQNLSRLRIKRSRVVRCSNVPRNSLLPVEWLKSRF